MTKYEFVRAIKLGVSDSIPSDIAYLLERKVPLKDHPDLQELSDWYVKLNEKEKGIIQRVMKMAAEHCAFSFLCVLDGVSAIENDTQKGKLELYYIKNGERQLLNEDKGEYLHDIYNEE